MSWIKKRTVLINIAVFLFLIIMLNILSFSTIEIYRLIYSDSSKTIDSNPVINLPNYKSYKKENLIKLWNETFESTHNYHYKNFIEYQSFPYTGDYINIGNDGYRHNGMKADDNMKNILLFGGSTMFGVGVSDDYTIPALLYRKLSGQFNVYNYGVSGYYSRHEVASLINYMNQNSAPDFVIFYDGVNDVGNSCIDSGGLNYTPNEKLIQESTGKNMHKLKYNILDNKSTIYYLYKIFFNYTEILTRKVSQKIFSNNKERNNKERNNKERNNKCENDKYATAVANTLIKNWVIADSIVTNMGGNFISILQPEINIGKPRKDHLIRAGMDATENIIAAYKKVYLIIKNSMHKYNYMHDMTDAFDTDNYIYIDHSHVSRGGNEIIANRIANIILEKTNNHNSK